MKTDNRTQTREPRASGLLHKLFVKPKRLPATAVQEHDWDSDVPSIKLSTAFMVILFLHVAVVGGVMLFRFMEKDAEATLAGRDSGKGPAPAAIGTSNASQTRPADTQAVRLDDPALAGLPRHQVKPHETLEMIANKHGVTREAITRTNRLNADNMFRAGMTLVIPPRELRADAPLTLADASTTAVPGVITSRPEPMVAAARPVEIPDVVRAVPAHAPSRVESARPVSLETPSGQQMVSNNTDTGTARSHVVKSGETLWAISKKYGVSVSAIMKANAISDAGKVRQGSTLRVPAGN